MRPPTHPNQVKPLNPKSLVWEFFEDCNEGKHVICVLWEKKKKEQRYIISDGHTTILREHLETRRPDLEEHICSNNESKHFAFKYHHWIITLRFTKGDIGTCYWQLTGQDPQRAPWALQGSLAIGGTRVPLIAESSGGQDCQGKVEGRGLVEAWSWHSHETVMWQSWDSHETVMRQSWHSHEKHTTPLQLQTMQTYLFLSVHEIISYLATGWPYGHGLQPTARAMAKNGYPATFWNL